MVQPQESSEGWVVGKGDPIPEGVESGSDADTEVTAPPVGSDDDD